MGSYNTLVDKHSCESGGRDQWCLGRYTHGIEILELDTVYRKLGVGIGYIHVQYNEIASCILDVNCLEYKVFQRTQDRKV